MRPHIRANGAARSRSITLALLALSHAACIDPGDDEVESDVSALTGTCDPARAAGAVPGYHRALLDTIARAEGTYRADANDGYDIAFGYHYFGSCSQHPGIVYCSGSLCSDASGRYQFLSTTWQGLGYPNFYPNYQDRGAMDLVRGRGANVPSDRALTYNELVGVMNAISWEWASLPPGRYGQPSISMADAWSIYSGFASQVGAPAPASAPSLAAGRNADGRLEVFYPRLDGTLIHDWQNDWPGPAPLGGKAKQVAVGQNADGRLEVVYVGTNNALYHNWQTGSGWHGEAALGGLAKQVAIARNADGRLEIVYVGTNDALYRNNQGTPNGGFVGERALGGKARQVVIGQNADGRLEAVYIGTNNALYHNWQTATGWSGEAALGGLAKQVAIARNADGRLEIIYVGTNDALYHNAQVAPNGAWGGEAPLGGKAKQIAIGRNADGRLEVFYVGTNNSLYHNAQTANGWGGEAALGGAAKSIAVASNADGRLELFYVGTNNALYHNWQVAPNGAWAGEAALGGSL